MGPGRVRVNLAIPSWPLGVKAVPGNCGQVTVGSVSPAQLLAGHLHTGDAC